MKNNLIQLAVVMVLLATSSCKKDIIAYQIESITIENFQATNNGSDWDPIIDTAPDIFIKLRMDTDLIVETDTQMNADAGTDYTFNVDHRISPENLDSEFQLQLVDDDQLSSDQIMETFSFQLDGDREQSFSDGKFEFSIVLEAIEE